jgi:hypothetical protein
MRIYSLEWLICLTSAILINCSKDQTQVHVCNLNTSPANITIKPDNINDKPISINDVAGGKTSDYFDIPPMPGGTVKGSLSGKNMNSIRIHAIEGNSYLITVPSGDNPTLSWTKE